MFELSSVVPTLLLSLPVAALVIRQRNLPSLEARLAHLEALSTRDLRTGLLNGVVFEQVALPTALHSGAQVSILLIDLDHFGRYNEGGYREGGDRALCLAAQSIQGAARRRTDLIFRLHTAGDEFVVMMAGAPPVIAVAVAHAVRRALANVQVPASIGVASTVPGERTSPDALIRRATDAMRIAKRAGGNRVAIDGLAGVVEAPEPGPSTAGETTMRDAFSVSQQIPDTDRIAGADCVPLPVHDTGANRVRPPLADPRAQSVFR